MDKTLILLTLKMFERYIEFDNTVKAYQLLSIQANRMAMIESSEALNGAIAEVEACLEYSTVPEYLDSLKDMASAVGDYLAGRTKI